MLVVSETRVAYASIAVFAVSEILLAALPTDPALAAMKILF